MPSQNPTLVEFWEKLNPKQRRLIHDLLRCTSKYRYLSMGLLPFVPLKVIVNMLRREPLSPWTSYLLHDAIERPSWDSNHYSSKDSRYNKSCEVDKREYAEIIAILSPPKGMLSKMAEGLKAWKQQVKEETNA